MEPDSPQFIETIRSFLQTSRTASLATVDKDGRPNVCNVQYAQDDDLNLYFVSNDMSAHSINIHHDPFVAMAVYAHDDRAQNIHGVQIKATAKPLEKPGECNRAWDVFVSKFAFATALPQFSEMIQQQTFYCLVPYWIRWIDNRRQFGWKVEYQLREPETFQTS